jgi:hypothetical protein
MIEAAHLKNAMKQSTQRSSIENNHRLQLNMSNNGRNKSNEMVNSSSSADREAYLVKNSTSILNENYATKKGLANNYSAVLSPISAM